jgi:phage tail-like protein
MTGAIGAAISNPTQVAQNLPSSAVALASSLGSLMAGPPKAMDPAYGLAYKFLVQVDGLSGEALGWWSKCTGLKMDFNPVAIKFGGNYRSTGYLPGPTTYPKIVLQRAVDEKSSKAVQEWLTKMTMEWVNPGKNPDPGGATITLFGPNNQRVLTWHLVNVRPASWSGPDLDASGGKVALETLELVHEGFQVTAGVDKGDQSYIGLSVTGKTADKVKTVKLSDEADASQYIQFANSPVEMKVERSTETPTLATTSTPPSNNAQPPDSTSGSESNATPSTTPGGIALAGGYQPNITRLTLADLYLVQKEGTTDVVGNVAMLIRWMSTNTRAGGNSGNQQPSANAARHKLKLTWSGFPETTVYLSTVNATYVQFDTAGKPIRAKVTITVNLEEGKPEPKTNPTSGGIPDRRSHLLLENDRLALLANKHYGSTARWRDIAEANDLDDPLRARPGHRLFIPARSELEH